MHTDDWQLLERFRREGSQAAFARLVERHLGFVYHVCRRRLRDGHLAEDAAQAVFVVLARRTPHAPVAHVTLSAWLYRTALHACANAHRARRRRLRHETVAARVRGEAIQTNDEADDSEEQRLERALGALAAADRDIVLMRFYEGRSLEQIGGSLGISAGTAAKRLSRAVARLRKQFAAAADGANLRRALCAAAPMGLAARACDVVAGDSTAASVTVHEIVKGVVRTMLKIKAKLIAATTGALVLGIGGGVMSVSLLLAQPAPRARAVDASASSLSPPATAPATTPATPRQVMREFGAAIRAGDAAALRALIDARDADNRRLTEVMCDYVQAGTDLRAAIAEKFGKPALQQLAQIGPITPIDYLGDVIDPLIDQLEETIDGDEATLVPPTPEIDKFILVRSGNRWKISADRITAEWTPEMWEAREGMLRRAGEGMRTLIQGVRDGQFANLDELKEELMQIQRNR